MAFKQATDFENYLLEKGYIQHIQLNGKFIPKNVDSYSSMVILTSYYIKDDIIISCGLWEYPYPPTLITRPRIESENYDVRKDVDMMFEKYSNAEIEDAIINKKTLYV